jgi:hypothetical protein
MLTKRTPADPTTELSAVASTTTIAAGVSTLRCSLRTQRKPTRNLSGNAPQEQMASGPPIASMSQPEHLAMALPASSMRTKTREKAVAAHVIDRRPARNRSRGVGARFQLDRVHARPSAGDGRRGDGAVTTPGLRQHFSRGLGVTPARAVMAMKPYCN